jgi:hypothetical protein
MRRQIGARLGAEPAAGHRVRRDGPAGDPQGGQAPRPALRVGRRILPLTTR